MNPNYPQQPPGFIPPTQAAPPLPQALAEPKKPSMEDLMQEMMLKQDNFIGMTSYKIAHFEGNVAVLSKQVTMLETPMGLV